MATVVAISNFLVQYSINDYLTYAAFTYPVTFLLTDLTVRAYGPRRAAWAVWVGFLVGAVLSAWLASPRLAIASGIAFIAGQFVDLAIFQRLRRLAWWRAPLASSATGSIVDTFLFFTLAFAGTGLPVVLMALGDLTAKLVAVIVLLLPFRFVISRQGVASV